MALFNLATINQTVNIYLRHLLDTAGYNSVSVHKDMEIIGAALPFVVYSLDKLPLTGGVQLDRSPDANHFRFLINVNTFGSLEGDGRQQAEAIASVLENGFVAGDYQNYKISSTIAVYLRKPRPQIEAEQITQLNFQANIIIGYP